MSDRPELAIQAKYGLASGNGQHAARTPVDVRNGALAADWLRAELGRGQLAGIFRRDDLLVHTPRIGEDGYLPPEDLALIDAGPAQVRPITTVGVKSLIETRYQCWTIITVRDEKRASKGKSRHYSHSQPRSQHASRPDSANTPHT
jgi:hypothetical protein